MKENKWEEQILKWSYGILLLLVYLPLIIYGGFGTSDDLALLGAKDADWKAALMESLTRSGHVSRPIYALAQVASLYLLGDNPIGYTIFRLMLWGWILYLSVKTFKPIVGTIRIKLFIFFFSFPISVSAHFFNCFQTGYLFSLLFWVLSLYLIKGTYSQKGLKRVGWSWCCLILSLLSCEIMFPLFILNIGLPLLYEKKQKGNKEKWSIIFLLKKQQVQAVFFIYVGYFIFKVLIAPLYQTEEALYGVGLSTASFIQSLYYFICLLIETPILLLKGINYLFHSAFIWLSLLLLGLLYRQMLKATKEVNRITDPKYTLLFIVALFICGVIFLLSGYPAATYGNYNKMLLPSFVMICLLLTDIVIFLIKRGYGFIVISFCFLWVTSMSIQIENFNQSWFIRKEILTDNAKKINKTDLGIDPIVLSNVPFFLEENYNNEHVFWLSWDFSYGLTYFGLEKEINAYPFCWQTLMDNDYYPISNVNRLLEDQPTNNLWVYEYNVKEKKSKLKKIKSFESYKKEQMTLRLNYHSLIEREYFRQYLKKVLKSKS